MAAETASFFAATAPRVRFRGFRLRLQGQFRSDSVRYVMTSATCRENTTHTESLAEPLRSGPATQWNLAATAYMA
jgi:hypothetical protein